MKSRIDDITENGFLSHYIQNAQQIMWFLGAGTSRTAGMPTAMDIVWDLKRKYYCQQENQDIQNHDINKKEIKSKIQTYLDSKSYPPLWSAEEYPFYFDLTFGEDYSAQQKYIRDSLSSEKISLNIGHRVLAAILEMDLTRIVFTTNFDEVIETAYSSVTGKSLTPFHLEGSYAALDALNAEQFPIYAKIHGDFRYKKIKNLTKDLLSNDKEIQKCFLAASNRYGLVVTGYSGRDENVMTMFRDALEQNNAFPQGLFWATPQKSSVSESVRTLIELARIKGVNAQIIETGTFDIMLSKIWRQIPEKPEKLDLKVCTAKVLPVSIKLPPPGKKYPILRTNALAITQCPQHCAKVVYSDTITYHDLNNKFWEHRPDTIFTYTDQILFWGSINEICSILDKEKVNEVKGYKFEDPLTSIVQSGFIKSFFEEALAKALCHDKPLLLRRKNKTFYAIVHHKHVHESILTPLKNVLAYKERPGDITGSVPNSSKMFWAEAISIKLEERNGTLWLLIRPDIWINPLVKRENATDFLRSKKIYRYNNQSSNLLDAWIKIIFGEIGSGQEVEVSCFSETDYPATFKINTRTAYSLTGGVNG